MNWPGVPESVRVERRRDTLSSAAEKRAGASAPLGRATRLRSGRAAVATVFLFLSCAPAFAQSALPPSRYAYAQLDDPHKEAEAKALMETLRCLVCQGQSIADSDSDMAGDMRALVRERIAAGEKPEAIRAWLVDRYGAWVSYKPTVEPLTWPLWAAPVLLVALGLWLARGRFRRKQA
jgi:cytochrome c-type biogenesis protein CcmH